MPSLGNWFLKEEGPLCHCIEHSHSSLLQPILLAPSGKPRHRFQLRAFKGGEKKKEDREVLQVLLFVLQSLFRKRGRRGMGRGAILAL